MVVNMPTFPTNVTVQCRGRATIELSNWGGVSLGIELRDPDHINTDDADSSDIVTVLLSYEQVNYLISTLEQMRKGI